MRKNLKLFVTLLVATIVFSANGVYTSAQTPNVIYRSQQDIADYVIEHPATNNAETSYTVQPSLTAPYEAGRLSDSTRLSAIMTVNQVRYIAGLNEVTIDNDYSNMCQHAALANAVNKTLSHYPTQPSDMSAEMYNLAKKGASSSNLAWASWNNTLHDTILYSWMDDSDDYNIGQLGHRRWLLNPSMAKTGFGAVIGSGAFSALYALDESSSSSLSNVVWPAQNMPCEYFKPNMAWSLSTGQIENKNNITVKLTKRSSGFTWYFSHSSSNGYFNVDNVRYGLSGCIIFRPDNLSFANGDVFDVTITGLVNGDISYTVNFFSLDDLIGENANVRSFVSRLYTVALGRNYDSKGLNDWTDKLVNGQNTGAEVAKGFFFSSEFASKNLSDSDYVDTLYKTMFNREPDSDGKANWMNALANGMSREYVYRGFAEGAEFKNLCDSFGIKQGKVNLTQNRDQNPSLTAFVARNYTKALGRSAEEAGINDWTGRILSGKATPADVTAGFIFSPEFSNKGLSNEDFVRVLYQTYFDREPDAGGYSNWVNQLYGGVSREYVVNTGFSCSQEFANLVASFGL